jgi:hypothetical protein
MNNMGLFSKSDKDKKEVGSNNSMSDIEKIKKDKNRDYSHTFLFKSPYGDWNFLITVTVSHFGVFLDTILSDPKARELWNDIKEKFGKDVDEQELLKVFKLYVLIIYLSGVLSDTHKMIQSYSWAYDIYHNPISFDGKLDKVRFVELLEKILKYSVAKLEKDIGEKTNQKDEQPK